MVKRDEERDTEIETLSTPTPTLSHFSRPMAVTTQNQDLISNQSSTERSTDDEDDRYVRQISATDSSGSEYSESFGGEIACCFSLPKCGKTNKTQGLNHEKIIQTTALKLTTICVFIFGSVLWVSIGLLMPSCMCSDIYKHLSNLSLSFMVVYILLMLFFIILFCLSSASLTSIQKGQVSRVFPFSVLLGFTFVGSVITNLFAIYKTGGWTGYIIYNDAFYQHAGAMFLKDEIQTVFSTVLKLGEAENLREMILKIVVEESVTRLEALERVLKWWILGGWFLFNIFLIILIYRLHKYRVAFTLLDLEDFDDVASVRSRAKSTKSSKSTRSKRTVMSTRKENGKNIVNLPVVNRDQHSPTRSDYTSVTKRSAYSMRSTMRSKPPQAGQPLNQSFSQNQFMGHARSRTSLAQSFSHHNAQTLPLNRPNYASQNGSRRNMRVINKTEDPLYS